MRNVSKYDALKIKATLLYVLDKLGPTDMLKALKIIYYAHKDHLARYSRGIIEDDFIKMELGPVPSFLYDAVKCARGKNHRKDRTNVQVLIGSFIVRDQNILEPNEEPDLDELSRSDIECLDRSIAENQSLTSIQLSDKSHSDQAWVDAQNNREMDVLQMAKDSGASEEILDLIQNKEEFKSLCS